MAEVPIIREGDWPGVNRSVRKLASLVHRRIKTIPYSSTVIVAKTGSEFQHIQAAIDSITDAADDKRYCVLVYPGDYAENITGKSYVEVMGMAAREAVNITGTTGPLYTFPDNEGHIFNLKFSLTPTTAAQKIIHIPSTVSARQVISNCLFSVSCAEDVATSVFDIDGGESEFILNKIIFNNTNTVAAGSIKTQRIWDIDGDAIIDLFRNIIDVDISSLDERVIIFDDASTVGGEIHIESNIVHVTSNNTGAYEGIVRFISYLGDTAILHVAHNTVQLTSLETGGTGVAEFIRLNSAGTGIVMSTANHVVVSGFATNRWANIAAGDTVFSHFDDITAADGWTGAGTATYASSLSSGDFNISDDLIVGDDIIMQGHLMTLGDGTDTDIILRFSGDTNSSDLTYEPDVDRFNFGNADISCDDISCDDIGCDYINANLIASSQINCVGFYCSGFLECTAIEGTNADFDTLQIDGSGSTGITIDNYKKIQFDAANGTAGWEFFCYSDDNCFIDIEKTGKVLWIRPQNNIIIEFSSNGVNIGAAGTYPASWTNYLGIGANGDINFYGTAGFYPRLVRNDTEPSNGTGATQIDDEEMIFWIDTNDSNRVWLMYNDNTNTNIVKVELT